MSFKVTVSLNLLLNGILYSNVKFYKIAHSSFEGIFQISE